MTPLRAALAATVTALALVSGCSSDTPKAAEPRVATLNSAPASAAPARTADAPRGVQLRLDTTDDETARYWDVYQDCLLQHGVKQLPKNSDTISVAVGTGRLALDWKSGEPKAAYVACADKKPLEPVELDPDRNPRYAAQWQDNVRCLRRHGLMVHATKPGEWTYDESDTKVPDNQEQLEDQCILEAFGAKKK
jgi:hypothetical protein